MTNEPAVVTPVAEAAPAGEEAEKQTRERSTIKFPYTDLDDAISVVRALHDNFGVECTTDQLAGALGQTTTSGAFRLKVSTARTFGLIQTTRGKVALTDNGRAIADEAKKREARGRAFLFVPLYNAIHDRYRGNVLPPTAALEREMANLGVSGKQTDKARQAFERSALQAGFFEQGRNRLVAPGGTAPFAEENPPEDHEQTPPPLKDDDEPPRHGLHPFIEGLLQTLPEPETDWSVADRVKWLQTAANIFDLIYEGDGGITVEAAMVARSPRPESGG